MSLTIDILPGEPLWTPDGYHVTDKKTGRVPKADKPQSVTFGSRETYDRVQKLVAQRRVITGQSAQPAPPKPQVDVALLEHHQMKKDVEEARSASVEFRAMTQDYRQLIRGFQDAITTLSARCDALEGGHAPVKDPEQPDITPPPSNSSSTT